MIKIQRFSVAAACNNSHSLKAECDKFNFVHEIKIDPSVLSLPTQMLPTELFLEIKRTKINKSFFSQPKVLSFSCII